VVEAQPARATAWISHGFEELAAGLQGQESDGKAPYDLVIVGSGYGGAIAAAELSGCTVSSDSGPRPFTVCVLERGKEYLSGMFPPRMADLAGYVRFSTAGGARVRGVREGLFDLRIGPDVSALVANGLGGGSLINAGVMERPRDAVFGSWPAEVRDDLARQDYFGRAKKLLGAADKDGDNTIERHRAGPPAKFAALKRLAGGDDRFRAASVTIAMQDKENASGVMLKECARCGDCTTGCNHGAKDSLDVNLLVRAQRRGAEIYTGATVLRLERDAHAQLWLLDVVHTDDKLRRRQGPPLRLKARKVILAAGTFGSTEILLRSRSDTLAFSRRLGLGFSANGDAIAVAYNGDTRADAVADESQEPRERNVGPTITGVIRLGDDASTVIEELAIPGPLRRVFEEVVTSANALHELVRPDAEPHGAAMPTPDPYAVDRGAIENSLPLAMMGDDGAGGALELTGRAGEDSGDGAIRVRWPEARDDALYRRQIEILRARAGEEDPRPRLHANALRQLMPAFLEKRLGGIVAPEPPAARSRVRILSNPMWQMMPEAMQRFFGDKHGPLFTAHPLGGCPMGQGAKCGVVDHLGRVFDPARAPDGANVHPGLVVLDGSIIPSALGINPALTIAAVSLRAVEKLRAAEEWALAPGADPALREERPKFRDVPVAQAATPTRIEIVERMRGAARLKDRNGVPVDCKIELTFQFRPVPLAQLAPPGAPMRVAAGELRIFKESDWSRWNRDGEPQGKSGIVQYQGPVSGELRLLHREASTSRARQCRSLRAWLRNRGLRDIWQWLADPRQRDVSGGLAGALKAAWKMFCATCAVASHAGEVRRLEYELQIDPNPAIDTGLFAIEPGQPIRGAKRLTYARRSNPWRQLMEMTLREFPVLSETSALQPILELDLRYLAQQQVPLLRIVEQQDQPAAIADLASFLAYFARLLVSVHSWSFRGPDAPEPREPQRLPGLVKAPRVLRLFKCGLPDPEVEEIDVDRLPGGQPVRVRLTRYRWNRKASHPVVMIHGYSASGTTFAHHAVRPNLAEHFCRRNRDVWILDLRTSSGMPTARHPWAFEDAGLADIPAAFDFIHRETGEKLYVVAHCMGSVMFSMAVLKPPEPGDPYFRERSELPQRVEKAVLSQIGPVVVMSPANILRAYVLGYARHYLPLADYDFRVKPDPGLVDQLIDRLLATLPYPEHEFDVENPLWPCRRTPFVGTRHRMDALYGRDFSLAARNGTPLIGRRALEYIDDLFGPLSIETVSQGIHLARMQVITTRAGHNEFALRENMKRWSFPTLSIHGEENGLADVATLDLLEKLFAQDEPSRFRKKKIPGFGHQDCLIGTRAAEVFAEISDFLQPGGS
jgi:choline dehydrogenase-like flavoprotein/pimeloyl-ACP methyl ester carboxylesterase